MSQAPTIFNPYKQAAKSLRGIEDEARGHYKQWSRNRLCWKCQKEKNTYKGSLTTFHGLQKFICADCKGEKK